MYSAHPIPTILAISNFIQVTFRAAKHSLEIFFYEILNTVLKYYFWRARFVENKNYIMKISFEKTNDTLLYDPGKQKYNLASQWAKHENC